MMSLILDHDKVKSTKEKKNYNRHYPTWHKEHI